MHHLYCGLHLHHHFICLRANIHNLYIFIIFIQTANFGIKRFELSSFSLYHYKYHLSFFTEASLKRLFRSERFTSLLISFVHRIYTVHVLNNVTERRMVADGEDSSLLSLSLSLSLFLSFGSFLGQSLVGLVSVVKMMSMSINGKGNGTFTLWFV